MLHRTRSPKLFLGLFLFFTCISFTHSTDMLQNSPGQQLSEQRKKLIENCNGRTMEASVVKYLLANDPHYVQDFAERFNAIIGIFYDLVSDDICRRTHSCLTFTQLNIEAPYGHVLEKVIYELIPFYFDTEGLLINVSPADTTTRNFIIAQLLKNGLDLDNYKNLLRLFNFHEVLAHEEETSTYLLNSLHHIATGGWLPDLSWYPKNIKSRIKDHPGNLAIETVLSHCCDYNFADAHTIISGTTNQVLLELYTESYSAYTERYCDEYGILTEFAHDPFWASNTCEEKQQCSKNIRNVTALNYALNLRAVQKKQLQETWDIADDALDCVHTAIFNLIDVVGTGSPFIVRACQILEEHAGQDRSALQQALFLPNGILKDFSYFPGAYNYQFLPQIFNESELLKYINELFYKQHVLAGTQEGAIARIELDQLHALYDPALGREKQLIDYDLEATTLYQRMIQRAVNLKQNISHYTKTTYTSLKKAVAVIANFFYHKISS